MSKVAATSIEIVGESACINFVRVDISMSHKHITFHKIYLFYNTNNFRDETLINKSIRLGFL